METCLLEKLASIDTPILADNEKDYNFLIKMKEYYNFKYDVYSNKLFMLMNSYYKFNYDNGITYDKKINKCIFLIDNLNELNLKPNEFLSLKDKKDLIILIDKKTKEKSFCSFYDEDIFSFYSDDYYFVTFKDSKIKNLFEKSIMMHSNQIDFDFINDKEKIYELEEKELFKLLPNYELLKINRYYEGIFILSYYKFNGFIFVNLINKSHLSRDKIIKRLKNLDDLIIGFIVYNDDNEIIDYAYSYNIMRELVEIARKKYIYIKFLDIKINKGNNLLKKDRHYIRM